MLEQQLQLYFLVVDLLFLAQVLYQKNGMALVGQRLPIYQQLEIVVVLEVENLAIALQLYLVDILELQERQQQKNGQVQVQQSVLGLHLLV